MAVLLKGGVSGSFAGVGDEPSKPLHSVSKPQPAQGHYRVARRFLPIASATAGANFVAFRNPSANPIAIARIHVDILQIASPTAVIEHRIGGFIARGYTVADGTGIAATLTLSGNNAKKRTSMATTGAVITETSAAGGLTAGTKTLDQDPFMLASLWVLAAIPTAGVNRLPYDFEPGVSDGSHPVILAQNEGFVLQNIAALGALSGVAIYYEISWMDLLNF